MNEIINQLKEENCFTNGKLLRWPEWLEWETVQELVNRGLLVRKFYKNQFGHVDYILA